MQHDQVQKVLKEAECLYSTTEVGQALDRMAEEITHKLEYSNPIILCVMTGALITTGHLLTRLHFPLELDYIHVTRYRGTTSGGEIQRLVEPRRNLENRTVLVIDDIMDGGLTLTAILNYCQQARAKEIYSAVLVNKQRIREPGVTKEPDFVGVTTPDRYLFGFGLDYKEYLRNVPGIYAVGNL